MSENEKNTVGGPVAGLFLWLAEKTDGRKTMSGALLLIGGFLTVLLTPEYRDGGVALIGAGIQLVIVGLAHKAVKMNV